MSWRRKEPGHQQPWYWPSLTELTRYPHVKGKLNKKQARGSMIHFVSRRGYEKRICRRFSSLFHHKTKQISYHWPYGPIPFHEHPIDYTILLYIVIGWVPLFLHVLPAWNLTKRYCILTTNKNWLHLFTLYNVFAGLIIHFLFLSYEIREIILNYWNTFFHV